MLAVAFDTLKLARKFEAAGFPPKQAQDASAALAETFTEWQASINLATREDVQRAETNLQRDITKTETNLQRDLAKTEASLRRDIQRVDEEFKQEVLKLEAKIREGELRVVIRLGSMIVGLGGLLIAIKFFG